jgi:hypothetical protein
MSRVRLPEYKRPWSCDEPVYDIRRDTDSRRLYCDVRTLTVSMRYQFGSAGVMLIRFHLHELRPFPFDRSLIVRLFRCGLQTVLCRVFQVGRWQTEELRGPKRNVSPRIASF